MEQTYDLGSKSLIVAKWEYETQFRWTTTTTIIIIQEIPVKTRQLATLDNHSKLADIHQRSLKEYTPVGKILEPLTFSQSMGFHPMASEQKTKMPNENVTLSAYINVYNSLLNSSDFISTQSSWQTVAKTNKLYLHNLFSWECKMWEAPNRAILMVPWSDMGETLWPEIGLL